MPPPTTLALQHPTLVLSCPASLRQASSLRPAPRPGKAAGARPMGRVLLPTRSAPTHWWGRRRTELQCQRQRALYAQSHRHPPRPFHPLHAFPQPHTEPRVAPAAWLPPLPRDCPATPTCLCLHLRHRALAARVLAPRCARARRDPSARAAPCACVSRSHSCAATETARARCASASPHRSASDRAHHHRACRRRCHHCRRHRQYHHQHRHLRGASACAKSKVDLATALLSGWADGTHASLPLPPRRRRPHTIRSVGAPVPAPNRVQRHRAVRRADLALRLRRAHPPSRTDHPGTSVRGAGSEAGSLASHRTETCHWSGPIYYVGMTQSQSAVLVLGKAWLCHAMLPRHPPLGLTSASALVESSGACAVAARAWRPLRLKSRAEARGTRAAAAGPVGRAGRRTGRVLHQQRGRPW
mmetsp:Transcript_4024/g.12894  ORF Transcript_4024/g.12894 Transcript_4024/m.12894 type:complete len:414 (-) Transcript_4024:887-2128(-)